MKPLLKSLLAIIIAMAISTDSHAQPRAGNWYQQQYAAQNYYGYGYRYQASEYPRYQYPAPQQQGQRQQQPRRQAQPAQQQQARPQQQPMQQKPNYQAAPTRDNNSQWLSDFDTAMARAQKQGRPLVALFVHHGCPECDRMDAILAQAGAMQNFENAVKARIEFTRNADVVSRLGLEFTPTLLVFSPTGNREVYREVGAISADRLRLLKPSIDSLVTGPQSDSETRKNASVNTESVRETSQADNKDTASPAVAAL